MSANRCVGLVKTTSEPTNRTDGCHELTSVMPPTKTPYGSSRIKAWTAYVCSGLPVLFMSMSSAMKLSRQPMVIEGFARHGISAGLVVAIGVVELACVVVYLVPATSVLGAILVTGYLGGAIMVHVGAEEVLFIAPLLLGILAWGGLYLRDERIRALLPTRRHDPCLELRSPSEPEGRG